MGFVLRDSGRAEDGHLPDLALRLEDTGGIPEFVHGPADDLQVQDVQFVLLRLQGVQQDLSVKPLAEVPSLELDDIFSFLKYL